ncbi:fumarate hydratase [Caldicellulosiruptoraceae bacterium PP1]
MKRIIKIEDIKEKIYNLIVEANYILPDDVCNKLKEAQQIEEDVPKNTLDILNKNIELAKIKKRPICQDTGMAVFFVEIGEEIVLEGSITDTIFEMTEKAYKENYFRKSVVKSPIERINTDNNLPPVIHYEIIKGDKLKIYFMPKGFGSENKSRLVMLNPADGTEGIINFVVETVKIAGSDPCPPVVVGIGVGGTFEKAAILSKKALLRKIGQRNEKPYIKALEEEILKRINSLGIGPEGFGGKTTALDVFIEEYPTHIAGLPVAVNICCHVARHGEIII